MPSETVIKQESNEKNAAPIFSGSQGSNVPKRINEKSNLPNKMSLIPINKNYVSGVRSRPSLPGDEDERQKLTKDIDYQKLKNGYDQSVRCILQNWMGLIYCILVLRTNLLNLILKGVSEEFDSNFKNHIDLETQIIHSMIKQAESLSHKQLLKLWKQVEDLGLNHVIIKRAPNGLKGYRAWHKAASKLVQLEESFKKYKEEYETTKKINMEKESLTRQKLTNLENLAQTKEAQYNDLLTKIGTMKKRDVQTRGRILVNMKSYKDLTTKKQKLVNIETEMDKLKMKQSSCIAEYSSKINELKNEIDVLEEQIQQQQKEKHKLRTSLEEEFEIVS